MTVIQFPLKSLKHSAPATTSRPSLPEAGSLTAAELCSLTELQFPADSAEDECGRLVLLDTEWAALARFFSCYGLRLPLDASCELAYGIWCTLYFNIGQGVRLAADGRADEVCSICSKLSFPEQEYARAVGAQDIPRARKLAHRVFKAAGQSAFLC
jgi:hypothetical protein